MDWDQIESKWAAMTRRVGGEMSIKRLDGTNKVARRMSKIDTNVDSVSERQVAKVLDQQTAMSTQ